MADNDETTMDMLKRLSILRGYRFEVSEDGNEERMIRPDGTVAVIARRKSADSAKEG